MAGVVNGQPVDAPTTNAAFLSKNGDDSTAFKIGLEDTDPASGAAISNLQAEVNSKAAQVDLDAHITDPADAHAASAITNTPSGNLAATTVQAALDELQADVDTRDTSADVAARFHATTGHHHDGVNSKKVLATNLDSTGGALNQVLKSDGAGGATWGAGGGGGAGGINFIGLDSSWAPTSTDDRDAETAIGNWAAYADAAGTSPVDATGGAPSTTITRITASHINGAASFKLTIPTGATRQGEGASVPFYIPEAYRGKKACIKLPFTLSGTVSEDDIKPFIYDVTNSLLITPFVVGKIIGTRGGVLAFFDVPSSMAQGRLAIHVARATNTGLVEMTFDDVEVGPSSVAYGMSGSDEQAFTITLGATTSAPTLGTTAVNEARWWRVGDHMHLRWNLRMTAAGTAGSGEYLIPLPTGYTIDSAKITAAGVNNNAGVGHASFVTSGTTGIGEVLIYDSTRLKVRGVYDTSGAGGFVWGSGAFALTTPQDVSISAIVPILGWSSNVSMAESSSFRISDYLANGARVTGSDPTSRGQYRSYLRQAGAQTYTETNGTPSTLPSGTSGIFMKTASTYAAGDASGEPSRYDLFVGKNKVVKLLAYKDAGRTGYIDTSPFTQGTTYDVGLLWSYDPTTGIVRLQGNTNSAATNPRLGANMDGGYVTTLYADLLVSENALMVGAQSCRSELMFKGFNGFSSTNTAIPYFTSQVDTGNTGTAFSVSNSSVSGLAITLLEDGIYSAKCGFAYSSGGQWIGLSKNSNQLTTSVNAITDAHTLDLLISEDGGTAYITSAEATFVGRAGDVIRPHGTASVASGSNAAEALFRIVKVNL